MKRKPEATEPATADTTLVVYPGPYPQITLRHVPQLGELTLDRDTPVPVPHAVAADLVARQKVQLVVTRPETTIDTTRPEVE